MIDKNNSLAKKVLQFLQSQPEAKNQNISANTTIAFEGDFCQSFNFLISGQVKVFKISESGKQLTLYHINKDEACILTTASIINNLPLPAIAVTITECQVVSIPARYVEQYFDKSKLWRDFIFSLLSNKMAGLINVVNDLAFHKLDVRLYDWLLENQINGVVDTTHQKIAEQLASTREGISRTLKLIEKQGLIELSRGKISVK